MDVKEKTVETARIATPEPIEGFAKTLLVATLTDMKYMAVSLPNGKYRVEEGNFSIEVTVRNGDIDLRFSNYNL